MSPPTKTWKKAELNICRLLGGQRRGASFIKDSGDSGTTDCVSPGFAIEIKHSKTPSWSLMVDAFYQASNNRPYPDDIPLAVIHKAGSRYTQSICCMALAESVSTFNTPDIHVSTDKFLHIGGGWNILYTKKKAPTITDMLYVNTMQKVDNLINAIILEKISGERQEKFVVMNIVEFRNWFM